MYSDVEVSFHGDKIASLQAFRQMVFPEWSEERQCSCIGHLAAPAREYVVSAEQLSTFCR